MRILFAEDEKDLNRIIKRKLKDEGYSVDACLNGEEALFMLKVTEYENGWDNDTGAFSYCQGFHRGQGHRP